jgi:hypothetical protein
MARRNTDNVLPISSFSECIVLATICGRALAHRQKVAVEQISVSGDMAAFEGFWSRHQWLHDMLNYRIQLLSTSPQVDPMLMFARIVAQTMVLFLHSVLESITWKTGDHLLGIIEYERLCIMAAHEVVNLVKLQGQLGYFKVRLPYLAYLSATNRVVGPPLDPNPANDVHRVFRRPRLS